MSAVAFIHSARCANVVSRNVIAASAASAMRRATSALSWGSKVSTVSPVAGLTVTLMLFKGGEPVHQLQGARPEGAILAELAKYL